MGEYQPIQQLQDAIKDDARFTAMYEDLTKEQNELNLLRQVSRSRTKKMSTTELRKQGTLSKNSAISSPTYKH